MSSDEVNKASDRILSFIGGKTFRELPVDADHRDRAASQDAFDLGAGGEVF